MLLKTVDDSALNHYIVAARYVTVDESEIWRHLARFLRHGSRHVLGLDFKNLSPK